MTSLCFFAGIMDGQARVCNECWCALQKKRVPPGSLVRVDCGPWPCGRDGQPLPPLTSIEERILAPLRVTFNIVVCKKKSKQSAIELLC